MQITPDTLLRTVVDVAIDNPGHVYDKPLDSECYYTSSNYPDGKIRRCIIGEAFNHLGLDVEAAVNGWLGTVDDMFQTPEAVSEQLAEVVVRAGPSNTAVQALMSVQAEQDDGIAWDAAVVGAAKRYPVVADALGDD